MPGYVEVRDKGVLKTKIATNNRSFNDVCSDLESYFQDAGKKLPPGVVREALQKIGVPEVRMIISRAESLEEKQAIVTKKTLASPDTKGKAKRKPTATRNTKKAEKADSEIVIEEPKGVISGIEYHDVEEALSVVESLSDSFLTSRPKEQPHSTTEKGRIKIQIEGTEEIVGAPRLRTAMPEQVSSDVIEIPAEAVRSSDLGQSGPRPRALGTTTVVPTTEVLAKALILGEEGVGKSSLIQKARLEPLEASDKANRKPYISEREIDVDDYRVRLQVWSFDVASSSRVSRRAFYEGTGVVIIVYSTSDRWSFESLDFWIKESTTAAGNRPPMVIVGNKSDLRASSPLVEREGPVSHEEGMKFAQETAAKLGSREKLHPVALIETSCLTGQGVEEVFRMAAELFVRSLDRSRV